MGVRFKYHIRAGWEPVSIAGDETVLESYPTLMVTYTESGKYLRNEHRTQDVVKVIDEYDRRGW